MKDVKPFKGTISQYTVIPVRNGDRQVIVGMITGHPQFADNSIIRTSYIEELGAGYVITLNSEYKLED